MGTLTGKPRIEVFVVSSVVGTFTGHDGVPKKARAWVLEDKTLIVATSPDGQKVERVSYPLESVVIRRDTGQFNLADGTSVVMRLKDCNCGMGVVGSARVITEHHKITRVKTPDWVDTGEDQ